jgi:hypothetical protein
MEISYAVMLDMDGERLSGRGEKDYEKSSAFSGLQFGDDRSQIVINGRIKPRWLRGARVRLFIGEVGKLRESTATHELLVEGKAAEMRGHFVSTVAKQRGQVIWRRME